MNSKLNELTRMRKKSHMKFKEYNSKVYEKFIELEEAAYSEGVLTRQTKLLIGIGISVVKNCEACMQWHIEEAARYGVTPQEIMDAIGIGIKMGGGPAVVSSRFAIEVMEEVFKNWTPKLE